MANKSAWDQLSLSERAGIIKLHVDGGILNLDDIKKSYNDYKEKALFNQSLQESRVNKFGPGGDIESVYYDFIEPSAVKAFNSNEEYNRYYGDKFGEYVSGKMNEASPYVLDALMLPSNIIGLAELPLLVYNGVKAAPTLYKIGKQALKKGKKKIGEKVLGMVEDINKIRKPDSHFRIVDKPAIDDAVNNRVIRSKTGLYHGTPEFLRANFSEYLDDIPGWEQMDANELKDLLESRGAFNGLSDAERKVAKFKIGNSTNHGNTVGYFKGATYPNYNVSTSNYVIETPESVGSFVAGHGGKEFTDIPLEAAGATLLKTNGSVKGASIPVEGSSYWEYSPFWEMWRNKKFDIGGDLQNQEPTSVGEFRAINNTSTNSTDYTKGLYSRIRRALGNEEQVKQSDKPKEKSNTTNYEHKDWMNSYSREEFDSYVNTAARKLKWALSGFKGWSKDDLDYLYSKLGDTGWDPKQLVYALHSETSLNPYIGSSLSSAVGLGQLTKDTMKTLFGDGWETIYNSYVDKTRPIKDIVDDTVKLYTRLYNNIKTEKDKVGYGRIKVNLLAPNKSLDSVIGNHVYKTSLTKEQAKKLKKGVSTYRDLMNVYDEEYSNKFDIGGQTQLPTSSIMKQALNNYVNNVLNIKKSELPDIILEGYTYNNMPEDVADAWKQADLDYKNFKEEVEKMYYPYGIKDNSEVIDITAPNTDIAKFIYGNKISKNAIEEIKRVSELRGQDPYDVLAHMLIEKSGPYPITMHNDFNVHNVVKDQIDSRLFRYYPDREKQIKQFGIYQENKKEYTAEEIRKAAQRMNERRKIALESVVKPESTIDAVALHMLLNNRDFNPGQEGYTFHKIGPDGKAYEETVKHSYLDMVDSAISSLKENMPDLFK